jgi:hypothetical protein
MYYVFPIPDKKRANTGKNKTGEKTQNKQMRGKGETRREKKRERERQRGILYLIYM